MLTKDEMRILNGCIGNPKGLELALPVCLSPNIPGQRSFQFQQIIDRAVLLLTEKYGRHASYKPTVAFHEAGHTLIAELLNYKVLDAQIWLDKDEWTGRVYFDGSALKERDIDDWLWRECLIRIAGFLGEKIAKDTHPSVTVSEKLYSLIIAAFFDQKFNQETGFHFSLALERCEAALEANLGIVNEIAWRLLNTGRVRGLEVAELMESAVLWPMSITDIGESYERK